jgi:hypothetical protein
MKGAKERVTVRILVRDSNICEKYQLLENFVCNNCLYATKSPFWRWQWLSWSKTIPSFVELKDSVPHLQEHCRIWHFRMCYIFTVRSSQLSRPAFKREDQPFVTCPAVRNCLFGLLAIKHLSAGPPLTTTTFVTWACAVKTNRVYVHVLVQATRSHTQSLLESAQMSCAFFTAWNYQ